MHVHCKNTYINKHSLHGLEVIHAYYQLRQFGYLEHEDVL